MFFNVLVGFAILVALVALVNYRAFLRVFQAGNAQVGKLGRSVWQADPQAIYQQKVDEATDEIREATKSVEEHKGLVNSLNRQVEDGRREVNRLDARVKASLQDDPNDTSGKAVAYVQQLQVAKNNLAKNEEQLAKANLLYESNIKKIKLAREKIKDAEDRGRQLGVELKMAKTNAAINDLATKNNVSMKAMDGLSEIEEELRRQIDAENAKTDVSTDLGVNGLAEAEEEERLRKAEGAALLEQYKKNLVK